jgi:phage head maturation protease
MTRQPDDSLLIYPGGEIKSVGTNGRIGGYAVRFGTANEPDKSSLKDYFTAATDFGRGLKTGTEILYHHDLAKISGKANPLMGRVLGEGEFKVDDVGVWVEGQLALRDEYERKLHDEAIAKGKMGWSTGTASHRVRRERQPNGSHKVLSWPLGLDCSITPTPAEPRTSVVSLKSLIDPDDDGDNDLNQSEEDEAKEPKEGTSQKFLDRALRAVSDLERAASGFVKLGPSKRQEIKAMRDALDLLLSKDVDPIEAKVLYAKFLQTEARIAGVIHG